MPVETKRHPTYKDARTKKRLSKITVENYKPIKKVTGTKIVKEGKTYRIADPKGDYKEGK
jgi:hypothetical protein